VPHEDACETEKEKEKETETEKEKEKETAMAPGTEDEAVASGMGNESRGGVGGGGSRSGGGRGGGEPQVDVEQSEAYRECVRKGFGVLREGLLESLAALTEIEWRLSPAELHRFFFPSLFSFFFFTGVDGNRMALVSRKYSLSLCS
jgi:hypothetical protein